MDNPLHLPESELRPPIKNRVVEAWESFKAWVGGLGPARLAAIGVGAAALAIVAGWSALFVGMPPLPSREEFWTMNRKASVQFVDSEGERLAILGPDYGRITHTAELPPYVSQAFIAAEDQRFMKHNGVDVKSIVRAALANVSAQRTVQGGSTITQQLIKNVVLDNRQTLRRKAQEASLAMQLEGSMSKDEILDLYVNRVYLGSNAYGIEAGAQTYFGKAAAELTIAEAAFLATLPKAPTRFAERKTEPDTIARHHWVLDQMVAARFISAQEAAAAKAQPLHFVEAQETPQAITGYVTDYAIEEAKRLVPDLPPDAVITLTVDAKLQRAAERALEQTVAQKALGAKQGALVVMDRTGAIRAMVGGRDYEKSQFNRATQAHRQPGSLFKTFVYAAALEQGLTPSSVRNDAPVSIANWQPGNYEGEYRGRITIARALAVSSNSVAVQVGAEVGPKRIADIAQRFGIKSPMHAYSSIALGASEVTLLEITGAYGVLANGGRQTNPRVVSRISTMRGDVLYEDQQQLTPQIYPRDSTEAMTGMLSNVVRFGTGVAAQVPGWQIAGKTGTSQSWRDAWFVGYSSELVAGVWLGNDDDTPTRKTTGGGAAAGLFSNVMRVAHRNLKPSPLPGAETAPMWLEESFPDELMAEGEDPYQLSEEVAVDLSAIEESLRAPQPPVVAMAPPSASVARPSTTPRTVAAAENPETDSPDRLPQIEAEEVPPRFTAQSPLAPPAAPTVVAPAVALDLVPRLSE